MLQAPMFDAVALDAIFICDVNGLRLIRGAGPLLRLALPIAGSPTAVAANVALHSMPESDPSSKPHGEDLFEPSTGIRLTSMAALTFRS